MGVRRGYVWTVAALIMQQSFTLSTLSSGPMNTVSVEGETVKMESSRNSSELPINWEFASAGSSQFLTIYTSARITVNLSSRYKIYTDNRTRYDIVIDSVDLSHAGTYICTPITEDVIDEVPATAQLTVLGETA